jgi:hypothetical protein
MNGVLRGVLLGAVGLMCSLDVSARAAPREPRCRGNPGVTGRCYWIRGEFTLSADSLFIVDRDDNGRWVVIRNARIHRPDWPVDDAVPSNLARLYSRVVNDAGLRGTVRGDFEVCPIPKQGFADTAYACIQTATHLRRISPDWMSPAQKRLHDRAVADEKRYLARAADARKKQDAEAAAQQIERKPGITPP